MESEFVVTNATWVAAMETFTSQEIYTRRIDHFLAFSKDLHSKEEFLQKLIQYFNLEREKVNDAGKRLNVPTSMHSWFSP